jgi:uracil-DNA glycosylase family 4
MTLKELQEQIQELATGFGLLVQTHGDGPIYSQIAVVGEAPGTAEVMQGRPFVGASGRILWDAFRKIGINRTDVYCTNVVKRSIVLDADTNLTLSKSELDHWNFTLRQELSKLPALKIVFVMGNIALQALLGERGVDKWRGSVIQKDINGRPITFVVAKNPAIVFRAPQEEVVFMMDCKKLHTVLSGKWKPYEITHHTKPTIEQARDYIYMLRDSVQPVSFDIELFNYETACIGLTNNATEGMCIAFRDVNEHYYTLDEEYELRLRIVDLLQNKKTIGQNTNFDSHFLWHKDKMNPGPVWFDTLLAHHTLYPTLPHNLGFLTAQYTNHPYYKDDGKLWKLGGRQNVDIDQFWRYNVKDVCITYAVHERLHNELVAQKQDKFFFEHVMRLQPELVLMTVGGIKTDTVKREELTVTLKADLERYLADFYNAVHKVTGETDYYPNPNSPKQLKELLFDKMKLIGAGTSTDETNRQRMLAHSRTSEEAKDVLRALNVFKEQHKFFSTYVDIAIDTDDRMRCEYKQYGVASAPGRLSSSKTLWGTGGNLQNQPERAHEMYVADPGYTFVYFDLSQAEARVVAYEADIPAWKEQFERARLDGNYDCHRALASEMFHVPYDEVPTADRDSMGRPTVRFVAKRCRHGLNYRMQPDRLAETTGLPRQEAVTAYNVYHRTTPRIQEWWREVEKEVRQTKCLYNCFGRRLRFIGRLDDSALDSIIAFKPQSAIGDKVCQAIYRCHHDKNWPEHARIVLNIHDALVALVRIGDEAQAMEVMRRHAEEPFIVNNDTLIIPADFAVSEPDDTDTRRWSTLKKIKKVYGATA